MAELGGTRLPESPPPAKKQKQYKRATSDNYHQAPDEWDYFLAAYALSVYDHAWPKVRNINVDLDAPGVSDVEPNSRVPPSEQKKGATIIAAFRSWNDTANGNVQDDVQKLLLDRRYGELPNFMTSEALLEKLGLREADLTGTTDKAQNNRRRACGLWRKGQNEFEKRDSECRARLAAATAAAAAGHNPMEGAAPVPDAMEVEAPAPAAALEHEAIPAAPPAVMGAAQVRAAAVPAAAPAAPAAAAPAATPEAAAPAAAPAAAAPAAGHPPVPTLLAGAGEELTVQGELKALEAWIEAKDPGLTGSDLKQTKGRRWELLVTFYMKWIYEAPVSSNSFQSAFTRVVVSAIGPDGGAGGDISCYKTDSLDTIVECKNWKDGVGRQNVLSEMKNKLDRSFREDANPINRAVVASYPKMQATGKTSSDLLRYAEDFSNNKTGQFMKGLDWLGDEGMKKMLTKRLADARMLQFFSDSFVREFHTTGGYGGEGEPLPFTPRRRHYLA